MPAHDASDPSTDAVTLPRDDLAPTLPRGPAAERALSLAKTVALPATSSAARAVVRTERGSLRYEERALLGQGGMGEVHLVRDLRIGREVALKLVRPDLEADALYLERFVREARIQGQLEHPAIVPVYDLDEREGGAPYFTMKRVDGDTLERVLEGLRAEDPAFVVAYPRRKLLTAFASACLALEMAHQRGVVHRDLKPANLMLGAYGEVYVLDWGIAKLVAEADPASGGAAGPRPLEDVTATSSDEAIGTPAYMAPEQVEGGEVDGRTDVRALGAILVELLTLEPLVREPTVDEALAWVAQGDPAERVRDLAARHELAPELEAICTRATARDPAARFGSPRALAEALERYLDGDRDLARRRELAAQHTACAEREASLALGGARGATEARRRAMRELGRALALDPESSDAQSTLLRLLTTPPEEMPADLAGLVERDERRAGKLASAVGATGFASLPLMLPLLWWMGVREGALLSAGALAIAGGIGTMAMAGRAGRAAHRWVHASFAFSAVIVALSSRLFGPLFTTPALALGMTAAGIFHPQARARAALLGLMLAAFLGPLALELAGVLPPSYRFGAEGLLVLPGLVELPAVPTTIYLTLSSALMLVAVAIYLGTLRDALARAQRALRVQSWQLEQLVGGAATRTEERPGEGVLR